MKSSRSLRGMRRLGVLGLMGTTFQLGSCNLGEFTTTTTTTLNGRDIVTFLVRSAILTPLENFINNGIANFFDEDDEG